MAYLEYVPTRTLYHYTSEIGLRGILSTREIWLSDLNSSNDPRELQLGLTTIQTVAEKIGRKEYSAQNARVLTQLIDKILKYYENSSCYTACFTHKADNINMWREYSKNGEGYSVGFRPRAITDMHGRIYKSHYVDDTSDEDLYNLISEIVKPVEVHGSDIFKSAEIELEIATALISIVNSLKHRTWDYEEEVRLTFASNNEPPQLNIPMSISLNGTEKKWSRHKIRGSDHEKIKYHALPFGKFSKDKNDHREAITEVIIGPNAVLSEADLRLLLLDNGYSNFSIKKSICAFR
ncbi:hypothetical protein ASF03_11280 [Rhizobium sp. Leaf68]|nr:hypothetical protein ASE62_10590 [Rhizobium sp. Leaf202]KQN84793.1 hypothetical protein ASF03_11280 [Rhizobium sp. Leaf68]